MPNPSELTRQYEGEDPAVVVEEAQTVNVDTDATEGLITALPEVIEESKKGYKTTEFWLVVATAILVNLNGIPLPEQYEGFVTAALAVVYALSRGFAKQGVPHVSVQP